MESENGSQLTFQHNISWGTTVACDENRFIFYDKSLFLMINKMSLIQEILQTWL